LDLLYLKRRGLSLRLRSPKAQSRNRGEQVVKQFSKFVGIDVHKATIAVSVADANGCEVRYVGEIANTPAAIEKLVGS
jgi:hypothetical protein